MAKGAKRKNTGKVTHALSRNNRFTEEDIDDEVDAFHKQRDVIPLDPNDEGDSDDDMEEPVFDLEDGTDGDTDNDESDIGGGDDDDSNGEDNGIDDDFQPKGFAAKIARQAKYLREKFGGIDDDMDDDAVLDGEDKKVAWGRGRNLYYDADNVDYELQSSDEDLPMEEEAEVLKIQREKAKFLSMEDFGLENADEIQSDFERQEKNFLGAFTGNKSTAKRSIDAVLDDSADDGDEYTKKDLSGLTKEEQMEVVYSSAPELVGLLAELNDALNQLKQMEPLMPEERERKYISKGGINILEAKKILLLAYCQAIGFYLLLKSEGHSVQEHPVKARLIEIKNLLEKANEIDAHPQTEEIVNNSNTRNREDEDSVPLDSVSGERHDLAEVAKSCTTAVNGTIHLIKDSSKDFDNKKGNRKQQDTKMGFQSMEMLKVRANLEAKLKQKGVFNTTNSKPVKDHNVQSKPVNKRLETFDDFDDEVHRTSTTQLIKPSQLLSTKVKKRKLASGDDDLPKRDDIGERRKKFELRVLARTGTNPLGDDTGDEDDRGNDIRSDDGLHEEDNKALEPEDEFYNQVKKQRAGKLMAKAQLYSRTPATPSSTLEIEADGKRQISYQMEKNRGLTRHRKKLTKNPRKKYKIKHQKAVIRRKGQVRDIRKPAGPYGGEASGINVNVSRSIRFNS